MPKTPPRMRIRSVTVTVETEDGATRVSRFACPDGADLHETFDAGGMRPDGDGVWLTERRRFAVDVVKEERVGWDDVRVRHLGARDAQRAEW